MHLFHAFVAKSRVMARLFAGTCGRAGAGGVARAGPIAQTLAIAVSAHSTLALSPPALALAALSALGAGFSGTLVWAGLLAQGAFFGRLGRPAIAASLGTRFGRGLGEQGGCGRTQQESGDQAGSGSSCFHLHTFCIWFFCLLSKSASAMAALANNGPWNNEHGAWPYITKCSPLAWPRPEAVGSLRLPGQMPARGPDPRLNRRRRTTTRI